MTINAALRLGVQELISLYSESESQAIILLVLEKITSTEKNKLKFISDQKLTAGQENIFHEMMIQLKTARPVQYILKEAWFNGLKFYVTPDVLIPRSETEELVEWILEENKSDIKVLDIGTGSGCIPVTLKKKLKNAEVWSCDISEIALNVARKNAAQYGTEINFLKLDFLNESAWDQLPVFDLIVSNPPYVTEKEKTYMSPNVLNFEPALALFVPDNNPLVFYEAMAVFGKTHLAEKGFIYTEINEALAGPATRIFQSKGYNTLLKKDMQQKNRMLKSGLQP
jgi:release factor glutamine methyltransferase